MWLLTILFVSHVRGIVAEFLNNLRETKLKIYKAVFVSAVISSELFKHKGTEPGGGGGGGGIDTASLPLRVPCADCAGYPETPPLPHQS